MATKSTTSYICSACGNETSVWAGKCPSCGTWNSLKELNRVLSKSTKGVKSTAINLKSVEEHNIEGKSFTRSLSEIKGFDNVLGGGFVPGEVVLIAGEPGVGKSTLLLDVCLRLASRGEKVIYFSGEESEQQILDRVRRISSKDAKNTQSFKNLFVVYATDVGEIIKTIEVEMPIFIVIDSIQTVYSSEIASVAGSVSQIRGCTVLLNEIIKQQKLMGIIVGQITKGGMIAGPKVLEHIVDCVLRFEGDKMSDLRTLRATKNRFGSTDEVAFFALNDRGIGEVTDPGKYFVSDSEGMTGVARSVLIQGQTPLIVEVQTLINRTAFGYPRRISEGYSKNRLELLSAILQKRMGIPLSDYDVYLKVLGGINVKDPSMDLAVAASILSVYKDKPVKKGTVILGEVSLAGRVVGVSKVTHRVKEATKSGAIKIVGGDEMKDFKQYVKINELNDLTSVLF